MSDAIYGDRCLTLKEPAWHRIGEVVQEAMRPTDAISRARVGFDVVTEPLLLADGTETGYIAVVREADESGAREVFGVAKNYELVHVRDIAEQLDKLPWPLASVGALHKGSELFFSFDLGAEKIVGEDYNMFLGIIHPYRPGWSWKAMLTPVRFVCQNTVLAGTRAASMKLAVMHRGDAKGRIDLALVEGQAAAMGKAVKGELKAMAKVKVTDELADDVLTRTFPYVKVSPTMAVDEDVFKARQAAALALTERLKATTLDVYDRVCAEYPKIAGTGYALYQAVVERADYDKARKAESAYEDALVGERAKQKVRAYEAVLSHAG